MLDGELLGGAHGFQLDEAAVRAALFFDIAKRGDAPVLEDQHFVAGLIDIAQQMRRDEQPDAAFFANLLDESESCAGAPWDRGRWWARRE